MKLPETVLIAGIPHKVQYCDNAAEVDMDKRDCLWGQHDPWTKTIRIYKNGSPYATIIKLLIHEMIHAYGVEMNYCEFTSSDENSEFNTNRMELLIFDFISRNPWLIDAIDGLNDEKENCADLSL